MTPESFPPWHPPFCVVPRLFTREECAVLIRLARDSQKLSPAMVMRQDGTAGVDTSACSARLASFREGAEVYQLAERKIRERLCDLNEMFQYDLFELGNPLFLPYINVLEYSAENSGMFNPHVDMAGRRGAGYRKLSLVVPLNNPEVYEGGRLIIDTGEKFDAFNHARVGDGIVFSSLTMHGVTPVTAGIRYSLVTFLQGPRFR